MPENGYLHWDHSMTFRGLDTHGRRARRTATRLGTLSGRARRNSRGLDTHGSGARRTRLGTLSRRDRMPKGWTLVEGELELDGLPLGSALLVGEFDGIAEGWTLM
jgi:hypothetical protein